MRPYLTPIACTCAVLAALALAEGPRAWTSERATTIDLVDLTTGARARIPHAGGNDLEPVWSPQGDRLAFVTDRDGNWEIYTYEPAKDLLRRVTDNPGRDVHPEWSPDGRDIVCLSEVAGRPGLCVTGRDGGGFSRLTESETGDSYPAWHPRSHRIYYSESRGIFILNPDDLKGASLESEEAPRVPIGSPGRRVYDEGELPVVVRFLRPGGECQDLAWARDGSLLAFAAERRGAYDLYVVTDAGARLRRITEALGNAIQPTWAPDGAHLAYTLDHGDSTEIRRVNSDGSYDVPMPHTRADDQDPSWSPDGATLAVVRPAE